MKASDISDERMLVALRHDMTSIGASNWRIARDNGWPEKIVIAKLSTMMRRRGLVDGCNCGCRGDWTIIQEALDA